MNKPLLIFTVLTFLLVVVVTVPAFAHHEEIPVAALSRETLDQQEQMELTITQIESAKGHYDLTLYEPLMALGDLYYQSGRYYLAAEVFRRTQHLTHRAHGVYTAAQLPSIDNLISALVGAGEYQHIDTQQHFRFSVASRTFDPADNRLVMAKVKLADWYRATRRFDDALSLYKQVRAADLTWNASVRVLRSEALTMYLADRCCAAEKLRQAYELVSQSDAAGQIEQFDAYADYQDMVALETRTQTRSSQAREPRYLGFAGSRDVLRMMAMSKNTDFMSHMYVDFGDANQNVPPIKTMGAPVAMCGTTFGQLVKGDTSDAELSISLTVTESGRPRDIQVEGDLPARLKRYVKRSLQLGKFQSAINTHGEPVEASLQFTQNFDVHRPAVTSRSQVPQWSNMLVSQTCQTKGLQRI